MTAEAKTFFFFIAYSPLPIERQLICLKATKLCDDSGSSTTMLQTQNNTESGAHS